MKYQAVLFDLDGTLVDSLPLILECFRYCLNEMEIQYSEDEVKAAVGLPLRDICTSFAGERGSELFDNYLEYQRQIHDRYLGEYQGTLEMLSFLQNHGYRLGVVTSKRREMAEKGIKLTGIELYIQVLVALEDAPESKPSAGPVLKALEHTGTVPGNTVYAGDSPFDIRCGKKAGVHTVGVTWGVSSREDLERENPGAVVDSWQQFLDFLGE